MPHQPAEEDMTKSSNRNAGAVAHGAARITGGRERSDPPERRLARQRRALPWVRVDKEYTFETDEGSASIADLFSGRSQLLVYHFMFGPDYRAGCPSCSAIADGFDGFVVHLANHDVVLWAVSRAPLAKLRAYKRRMGWAFPWRLRSAATSTSTSTPRSPRSNSAREASNTTTDLECRSLNSLAADTWRCC